MVPIHLWSRPAPLQQQQQQQRTIIWKDPNRPPYRNHQRSLERNARYLIQTINIIIGVVVVVVVVVVVRAVIVGYVSLVSRLRQRQLLPNNIMTSRYG